MCKVGTEIGLAHTARGYPQHANKPEIWIWEANIQLQNGIKFAWD